MQAHSVRLMPFRGMTGWVCDVDQYPLPDGLEERMPGRGCWNKTGG